MIRLEDHQGKRIEEITTARGKRQFEESSLEEQIAGNVSTARNDGLTFCSDEQDEWWHISQT